MRKGTQTILIGILAGAILTAPLQAAAFSKKGTMSFRKTKAVLAAPLPDNWRPVPDGWRPADEPVPNDWIPVDEVTAEPIPNGWMPQADENPIPDGWIPVYHDRSETVPENWIPVYFKTTTE